MAMNIDFTGKTVLVTGGGRGLGKEMALQFAGCGANVYIANRKEDQGLATVKEIEALNKPFDHNYHQALMQEPVEGVESGMVVEVLQKGYMLKDRVLRAALVKVSE